MIDDIGLAGGLVYRDASRMFSDCDGGDDIQTVDINDYNLVSLLIREDSHPRTRTDRQT